MCMWLSSELFLEVDCYSFRTFFSVQAKGVLEDEMLVVKEGMGHKELTPAEYASIWEECYKEVLYVPAQNRYTRYVVRCHIFIKNSNIVGEIFMPEMFQDKDSGGKRLALTPGVDFISTWQA